MVYAGYATPTDLFLHGGNGRTISSSNGVRQGDPLSSLLYSLYVKDIYAATCEAADVRLYAFIDDLYIVGQPMEVMKAFGKLQQLLHSANLECNCSKSTFVYFHNEKQPLSDDILHILQQQQISIQHRYFTVLGAIVGGDEDAITLGLNESVSAATMQQFLRRLTNHNLSVQSAMILLRKCGFPKLNYLLRCIPGACIAE